MSALSEMIRTQESTPLGAVIIAVAVNGGHAYAELAAAELAALRAELAEQAAQLSAAQGERDQAVWEWHDTLERLATATNTAEVWERQHKQAVDIIEAMDLERGELMLARDYARDEA